MLEIRHLVKHFGPLKAVDDISFTVPRGEVLGFLGPNGAGKSTTMKMITGFLAPTAGTAIVCGHDIATQPIAAKKCIGYLPEGAPAYPDMTPADFLDFIAHIRGFAGAEAKNRIGRVVEMIRIAGVLHQPIETLSKGFKRRVGVAQALLHDPEVLILDEPTDGLDPNQKYEMRKIITHGRILADGTPAQLAERSRHHNAVRLGVASGTHRQVRAELARLPGVAAVEAVSDSEGDALMIFPGGDGPIVAKVADLARAHGWEVTGLRVERGRLDDVFREITTVPQEPATVAA